MHHAIYHTIYIYILMYSPLYIYIYMYISYSRLFLELKFLGLGPQVARPKPTAAPWRSPVSVIGSSGVTQDFLSQWWALPQKVKTYLGHGKEEYIYIYDIMCGGCTLQIKPRGLPGWLNHGMVRLIFEKETVQ